VQLLSLFELRMELGLLADSILVDVEEGVEGVDLFLGELGAQTEEVALELLKDDCLVAVGIAGVEEVSPRHPALTQNPEQLVDSAVVETGVILAAVWSEVGLPTAPVDLEGVLVVGKCDGALHVLVEGQHEPSHLPTAELQVELRELKLERVTGHRLAVVRVERAEEALRGEPSPLSQTLSVLLDGEFLLALKGLPLLLLQELTLELDVPSKLVSSEAGSYQGLYLHYLVLEDYSSFKPLTYPRS
jgi:hypothetical protein